MELKHSIALVTGGASGLGQATVEAFVSRGAKVVILDINEENAKKIIENLGEDNVLFICLNHGVTNSPLLMKLSVLA